MKLLEPALHIDASTKNQEIQGRLKTKQYLILCFLKNFRKAKLKLVNNSLFRRPHPNLFHLSNHFKKSTPNQRFYFYLETVIIGQFFKSHVKMAARPFFCLCTSGEAWIFKAFLDKTLPGLGYELVDFELTAQGDLRISLIKTAASPSKTAPLSATI